MIKAIERVKAHYQRLVDAPKQIRVPEWDAEDDEFIIYATPLTLQERTSLQRFAKNSNEMSAELIIMKAKDKEGERLFSKEDKPDLMRNASSGVLARIAKEIFGQSDDELFAEAEKN